MANSHSDSDFGFEPDPKPHPFRDEWMKQLSGTDFVTNFELPSRKPNNDR